MAQKDITRRDFLKVMGVGTTTTVAALCGCTTEKAKETETTPETAEAFHTQKQAQGWPNLLSAATLMQSICQ